jgi:hypothetical protein
MTKILNFFSPKGGQGTTTMAAAYAAHKSKTLSVGLVPDLDTFAALGVAPDQDGIARLGNLTIGPWWLFERDPKLRQDLLVTTNNPVPDAWTVVEDRVLVIRNEYLALRRAMHVSTPFERVLMLRHPEGSLDQQDVEQVVGGPVVSVDLDPGVARLVDAGLLGHKVPKSLTRALDRL